MGIPKVKVTVIRKLDMRDVHPEGGGSATDFEPVCPLFELGDEFVFEVGEPPWGFCQAAFDDIYRYISGLRFGANYPWMAEPGTAIACCTDGLRPVVFFLERLDPPIAIQPE
jgi:uncharacterized repeat protein (TIGR04076 family)